MTDVMKSRRGPNGLSPLTGEFRDKSVRVIFVTNSLHSGGAEKQMLWMAKVLVEAGVPCAIFELRANPGNARLRSLIETSSKEGAEFFRAAPSRGYLRAWFQLRAFLRAHPSALVWTWGYRSDFFMLTLLRLGLRPRCWICSLRSANWEGLKAARNLLRACGRFVTLYAANTRSNCEMLEQIYPPARGRSKIIYNFVPEASVGTLALPRECPRPLRVIMLGNIDIKKKGYDLVIELAAFIKRDGLPVEIHVAGRPDREKRFEQAINARNLSDVLIYHGETGEPHQFLQSGHCYLLTSRLEGMPNALLEAMGIGLPAIATKVGDLDRLAHDRGELRLVAIEDVAAIKQCLIEMLADWPAAVAMGERGRRWCQRNFAYEACREQLFDVVRVAAKLG